MLALQTDVWESEDGSVMERKRIVTPCARDAHRHLTTLMLRSERTRANRSLLCRHKRTSLLVSQRTEAARKGMLGSETYENLVTTMADASTHCPYHYMLEPRA